MQEAGKRIVKSRLTAGSANLVDRLGGTAWHAVWETLDFNLRVSLSWHVKHIQHKINATSPESRNEHTSFIPKRQDHLNRR